MSSKVIFSGTREIKATLFPFKFKKSVNGSFVYHIQAANEKKNMLKELRDAFKCPVRGCLCVFDSAIDSRPSGL